MSFFKLHKPLVYKYKPIYYDPKKEASEERKKQMSAKETPSSTAEEQNSSYEPKILKRGVFREMADKDRYAVNKQKRMSNIRLVVILGILFLIAYYLLK